MKFFSEGSGDELALFALALILIVGVGLLGYFGKNNDILKWVPYGGTAWLSSFATYLKTGLKK